MTEDQYLEALAEALAGDDESIEEVARWLRA